jgi:AcrR family transcriptional regulator
MTNGEKQLLDLFEQLATEQQERLIDFAEFLSGNPPDAADIAREPVTVPRPDDETVTLAIRRLVRTYPMLDRRRLMVEASRFVAQHALEGRAAAEVIDELEQVFARHYQQFKSEVESRKAEGQQ